jgi:hypothetical protein
MSNINNFGDNVNSDLDIDTDGNIIDRSLNGTFALCGATGMQLDDRAIIYNVGVDGVIDENIDLTDLDATKINQVRHKTANDEYGVLSRFKNVHFDNPGKQWLVCCPAHVDHTASLSIKYTDDKKWLFFCHAGCTYNQIIVAAGLTPEMLGRKPARDGSWVEAVYKYTDENGEYLFESKKIRLKNGDKKFIQNIKGVRKVLYNLPEVIKCCKNEKPLVIVEGEKDVESIRALTGGGWAATTNPGGARKWVEEYSKSLQSYGLKVAFIFADNDNTGRLHALQVAKSLTIRDIGVKIISFPDMPEHSDFSDWLDKTCLTTQDESKIVKLVNDLITAAPVFEIDETDRRYAQLRADASISTNWTTDNSITEYISSCYYNQKSSHYYMKSDETWQDMIYERAKTELGLRGIPVKVNPEAIDQQLPDVELALSQIRKSNSVDFAGPIAGYMAGVYVNCGKKVLVTSSPDYPIPVNGDFSISNQMMLNMLGAKQKLILDCKLKLHAEQLYKGQPHQEQVIILIGPGGSGKGRLQNMIITPLLGGRVSRVYDFLTGQDNYNADMYGCEHLMIEDDSPSVDSRSRNILTVKLTAIAANEVSRARAMYQQAVNLTAIQLVTLSANEENINTLPYINNSSADKIMLFKCEKCEMPMPTGTPEERKAFADKLAEEIPAYLYYLLHELVVPEDLLDDRYGVKKWHHPDILKLLETQSPEGELLDMIEDCLFTSTERTNWEGTTSELMVQLSLDSRFQRRSEKLLYNSRVAGILLKKLSKSYPNNYVDKHSKHGTRWEIRSQHEIKIDSDIQNFNLNF